MIRVIVRHAINDEDTDIDDICLSRVPCVGEMVQVPLYGLAVVKEVIHLSYTHPITHAAIIKIL